MGQREVAPLGIEQVEIQFAGEVAEEVDTLLVEPRAVAREVVRANDCRVAPGAAPADVAFLEDRHVGDAVVPGEVVRCAETMPSAADDDGVVLVFELRRRAEHPRIWVILVEGVLQQSVGHREAGLSRNAAARRVRWKEGRSVSRSNISRVRWDLMADAVWQVGVTEGNEVNEDFRNRFLLLDNSPCH